MLKHFFKKFFQDKVLRVKQTFSNSESLKWLRRRLICRIFLVFVPVSTVDALSAISSCTNVFAKYAAIDKLFLTATALP